jgi:hypothetical protein
MALLARSPIAEQYRQIGSVNDPVNKQVRWAGAARPPASQQDCQVTRIDKTVTIQVSNARVTLIRHAVLVVV